MFGFWEILFILGLGGYILYNYIQKKERQLSQQQKNKIKEEEIIDLDEDSYEILDD